VDIFRPDHLVLSLDVWIEEFDKVEMIGKSFPGENVVKSVLVSDVTFTPDIG
jgi:hypothetical protein